MWLLNAISKELEWFVDEDRPRYAILSYAWGDEEVTFQDRKQSWAARMKSLKACPKILETCRLARKDRCRYVWIDTWYA